MDFITIALGFAKSHMVTIGVPVAAGVVLRFILGKYVPKEMVQGKFNDIIEGWRASFQVWLDEKAPAQRKVGRGIGKALTDWGTRLPVIGSLWNMIVEPYIIILFEGLGRIILFLGEAIVMVLKSIIKYFLIEGVQVGALSDNPSLAGETKEDRKAHLHRN